MMLVGSIVIGALPVQEWLDSEHVVVGTKCNKLLCLNTSTGKVCPALLLWPT